MGDVRQHRKSRFRRSRSQQFLLMFDIRIIFLTILIFLTFGSGKKKKYFLTCCSDLLQRPVIKMQSTRQ
jgi:hypothetical protein